MMYQVAQSDGYGWVFNSRSQCRLIFPENSFPRDFISNLNLTKICKIPLQIFQMNYLLKRIKIQQNIYLMGGIGQSNDTAI